MSDCNTVVRKVLYWVCICYTVNLTELQPKAIQEVITVSGYFSPPRLSSKKSPYYPSTKVVSKCKFMGKWQ